MSEPQAATQVEIKPKIELYVKEDNIPTKSSSETNEQYIETLKKKIEELNNDLAQFHKDYLDVVNKHNVIPKAYADETNRKYLHLMTDLKRFGLYIGQELK